MNDDITIVIKTFMRSNCLIRLLTSIERLGWANPIVIADDSEQSSKALVEKRFPQLNITYLELPFDVGLSKGRNECLKVVKTDYFLLCDDDFVFDKRTDISSGLKVLIEKGLDILGGYLRDYPGIDERGRWAKFFTKAKQAIYIAMDKYKIHCYEGKIIPEGRTLLYKLNTRCVEPYAPTDIVLNFFLAKTEMVKNLGWHEELKTVEHSEFFYRAKCAGLKVGVCDRFSAKHFKEKSREYMNFRVAEGAKLKAIKTLLGYGFDRVVYERNASERKVLYVSGNKLIESKEPI